MRRVWRLALAGAITILVTGCVTTGKFKAKENEARRYQTEVSELARRHQRTMADLDSTIKVLTDQIDARHDLERDTTRLNSSIRSLEGNIANLRSTLSASNAEKDLLISSMSQAREQQDAIISGLRTDVADAADRVADLEVELELLGKQTASTLAEVESNFTELVQGLQGEINQGEIIITSLQDKLTVNIVDQVLFESGHAEVKLEGRDLLGSLANVLRTISAKQIQIEGHTDNVPIGRRLRQLYPTNWELSNARATNVARFLIEDLGLDPTRISTNGFGEFRPVATNTTEEGRQKNRRIEIVLLPYVEPPFIEVPPSAETDSLTTMDALAPGDTMAVSVDPIEEIAPADSAVVPADSTEVE